ncbi:MAG: FtsQ-type POTRA domain-containing protein [Patescibacteria group bacterium]
MKLSIFRPNKTARIQRMLKPASEAPKYANPYFPKVIPKKTSAATSWLRKDGWAFLIAAILIFGGGGFFMLKHSFFQITQIEVDGNQRITTEEINSLTNSILGLKALGFIPQDSYWTVRTSVVETLLRQQIKQSMAIDELTVTKKFPNTLSIHLRERVPSMNWVSGDTWYVLDPEGVIVQPYATEEERDLNLPTVIDQNQTPVQAKQQIVTAEYVDFLRELQTRFTPGTNLEIDHFEIPTITCQQKQFVAEQAIENELSQTQDSETKQKIRDIQERFQSGEIDIDTSLQLIQDIRLGEDASSQTKQAQEDAVIAFKAQYVAAACDLKTVLRDVGIRTKGDQAGFLVYLDSKLDLDAQMENLTTVIREKVPNPKSITYIDVRYTDRAYIK